MTVPQETAPIAPLPAPEDPYVHQLRQEAEGLSGPEREVHEALIAELVGEMALAEQYQAEADRAIAAARSYLPTGSKTEQKETIESHATVDLGRIGWIPDDEEVALPATRITAHNITYDFVDLTDKSRITKDLMERLNAQGLGDELRTEVRDRSIPRLWRDMQEGNNLRPIHLGNKSAKRVSGENSLNTSYPSYKVGVRSTQNRAIIMALGKNTDGTPVFGLGALYDHDDDKSVNNKLYLKRV